jgi:hypothetical protein
MKETTLIKMRNDIKDLQQFVMMLHMQVEKLQGKTKKVKNIEEINSTDV